VSTSELREQVAAFRRELKEAHERQAATSEVLKIISRSTFDLQKVLDTLTESASRLCDAFDAVLLLREGDFLRIASHYGDIPVVDKWPVSREWISGRAAVDRKPVHVHDLQAEETDYPMAHAFARQTGHRTTFAVPLMRQDEAIGAISIRRMEVRPFTEKQIELMQTFADQAVIAIENARLFDEVKAKTCDLEASLQQQTATADVLKVINRSTFDLEAVFNAVSKSAMELCSADAAGLFLRDGDVLCARGVWGMNRDFTKLLRDNPVQINMESHMGWAVLTGRVANIADFAHSNTKLRKFYDFRPFNSFLAVPLMRDAQAVGVFTINRDEAGGFTDREVDL
jgi:two-component system, NtrC family, sensor kinase